MKTYRFNFINAQKRIQTYDFSAVNYASALNFASKFCDRAGVQLSVLHRI